MEKELIHIHQQHHYGDDVAYGKIKVGCVGKTQTIILRKENKGNEKEVNGKEILFNRSISG